MTVANGNRWLLWLDGARTPAMNMAVDELLLAECRSLGAPLLRVYSWDRPAASYGYSQGPEAVRRKGLALVRRPTGGGVVYHDADFTYTVVAPPGHKLLELDRMQSYQALHEAVLAALEALGVGAKLAGDELKPHDRATLQCFVSPSPRDVLAEGGEKLAGAAQRRTRQGLLHQGSVFLTKDMTPSALSSALVKAFERLLDAAFSEYNPSAELLDSAEKLANLKYESEAWNLRKEPPGGA